MDESVTIDGQTYRFGCRRPTDPVVVAALSRYIDFAALAAQPPPPSVDYGAKSQASMDRMYVNDRKGCCVVSGKFHAVGAWSGNDTDSQGVILGTDQEVESQYHAICGAGDNGCIITRVMDVFQRTGLTMNGVKRKIDGYAHVDFTNKLEVQTALYLFGGLCVGFAVPNAWVGAKRWRTSNADRIVGGHDVQLVGYDENGVKVSTWGSIRDWDWDAFTSKRWTGECWAMLGQDWYGQDQRAGAVPGLHLQLLKDDLKALAEGRDPIIPTVTLDWNDIWPRA